MCFAYVGFVYVCVCVYVWVCSCEYARMCACVCAFACVRARVCMCVHSCMWFLTVLSFIKRGKNGKMAAENGRHDVTFSPSFVPATFIYHVMVKVNLFVKRFNLETRQRTGPEFTTLKRKSWHRYSRLINEIYGHIEIITFCFFVSSVWKFNISVLCEKQTTEFVFKLEKTKIYILKK